MAKRNWHATAAHFRNSAGSMKDKREPRGGTTNEFRDHISSIEEEMKDKDSILNSDAEYQEWLDRHQKRDKEVIQQFCDLFSNDPE